MKQFVAIFILLFFCVRLSAQIDPPYTPAPEGGHIIAAEYFIDTDPGIGSGTPIAVSPSTQIENIEFTIDTVGLLPGVHNLYIRTLNAAGVWSHAIPKSFVIEDNPPYTADSEITPIISAEYFTDTDPGIGNGTPIVLSAATQIENIEFVIDTVGLLPGVHHLYIRTLNAVGVWSHAIPKSFVIEDNPPYTAAPESNNIIAAEYFIDTDPGLGNGTPIVLSAATQIENIEFVFDTVGLLPGVHHLYIRTLNAVGVWSHANIKSFVIENNPPYSLSPVAAQEIIAAEYFIDTDPGMGNGSIINIATPVTDIDSLSFDADIDGLSVGIHRLYVRSLSAEGIWSLAAIKSFEVSYDPAYPIPPVGAQEIVAAEYFIDTDPGIGNGVSINIVAPITDIDSLSFDADIDGLSVGIHRLYVRSLSAEGVWGLTAIKSFEVSYDPAYPTAPVAAEEIVAAEYFIDTDPGIGNAKPIGIFTPAVDINNILFFAEIDGLNLGIHRLYVRTLSTEGVWSITAVKDFEVSDGVPYPVEPENAKNITAIEYFIDTDPGFGNGTQVPVTPAVDIDSIDVEIDITGLEGVHHVFVRSLNAEGSWSLTSVSSFEAPVLPRWYADADGDGFGNVEDSIIAEQQPIGYVADSTDCNDNDATVWRTDTLYIDADGDGFTAGTAIVCYGDEIPAGYTDVDNGEDCNDNNPLSNSQALSFSFSGSPGFEESISHPASGRQDDIYRFEVEYTNLAGNMPAPGYPRLMLDFEGNGVYTNPQDIVLFLSPKDPTDTDVTDGKTYTVAMQGLALNANWKAAFIVVDTDGCERLTVFNGPHVTTNPNISIFADDIKFSNANPAPGSVITVSATIHNTLPVDVDSFYVALKNYHDTSVHYPLRFVPQLLGNASTVVQWNITTPDIPAWVPMGVVIDTTNLITEVNELDNSAIRPFVNGNFELPGSILATASAVVVKSLFGDYVVVSGTAHYTGTAVPLPDSSVAGAQVSVYVVETGQTYMGTTINKGTYSVQMPIPDGFGLFHVQVSITDFTLTGEAATTFSLSLPPEDRPDLVSTLWLNTNEVPEGGTLSGTVKVLNGGVLASGITQIRVTAPGSEMALIGDFPIPALAPGEEYAIPDTFAITYNNAGMFTVTVQTDPLHLVVESNENNNFSNGTVRVCPLLPDILAQNAFSSSGPVYTCYPYNLRISNSTCLPVNVPFSIKAEVYQNNVLVNEQTVQVSQVLPRHNGMYDGSLDIPFNGLFSASGIYSVRFTVDVDGEVEEYNETNNTLVKAVTVLDCLPDLEINNCPVISPDDVAAGGDITVIATIVNKGQSTAMAPFTVGIAYGGEEYSVIVNTNIARYASLQVPITLPVPDPACGDLLITVDANNNLNEEDEGNNTRVLRPGYDFRFNGPLSFSTNLNQPVRLETYIVNENDYTASSVQVKFEVSGPGITGFMDLGTIASTRIYSSCNTPSPFGTPIALPTPFVFTQSGVYQVRATLDEGNIYAECNENNNVRILTYNVVNRPDYRILSEYIAPSTIKPDTNQAITINITYENIGASNITDSFNILVIADTTPLETIRVRGLLSGAFETVELNNTWSTDITGVHILRAVLDPGNEIIETTKSNNEATRAVNVCSVETETALPDFSFIQNGASISFRDLSSNATDYHWDFGDGDTTKLVMPVKTYEHPGIYNIKLSVANACGSIFKTDTIAVPGISKVESNTGHDSAVVTVNVYGISFEEGAAISLVKPGFPNIEAEAIQVINSQKIICRFNLIGQPIGQRDVRIILPSSGVYTLANGFTVVPSEPYKINVAIGGQKRGRRNEYIPTPIYVSNMTSSDALGVLFITKQAEGIGRYYRNISLYDRTQSTLIEEAYQYLLANGIDTNVLHFEYIDSNRYNTPFGAFIIPNLPAKRTHVTELYQISSFDAQGQQAVMARPLLSSSSLSPTPDSADGRYLIGEFLRVVIENEFDITIDDGVWYNCFNPTYTAFVNDVLAKAVTNDVKRMLPLPAYVTYMITQMAEEGCINGLPAALTAGQLQRMIKKAITNLVYFEDVQKIYNRFD